MLLKRPPMRVVFFEPSGCSLLLVLYCLIAVINLCVQVYLVDSSILNSIKCTP
jgi:hypothetical protein